MCCRVYQIAVYGLRASRSPVFLVVAPLVLACFKLTAKHCDAALRCAARSTPRR